MLDVLDERGKALSVHEQIFDQALLLARVELGRFGANPRRDVAREQENDQAGRVTSHLFVVELEQPLAPLNSPRHLLDGELPRHQILDELLQSHAKSQLPSGIAREQILRGALALPSFPEP